MWLNIRPFQYPGNAEDNSIFLQFTGLSLYHLLSLRYFVLRLGILVSKILWPIHDEFNRHLSSEMITITPVTAIIAQLDVIGGNISVLSVWGIKPPFQPPTRVVETVMRICIALNGNDTSHCHSRSCYHDCSVWWHIACASSSTSICRYASQILLSRQHGLFLTMRPRISLRFIYIRAEAKATSPQMGS